MRAAQSSWAWAVILAVGLTMRVGAAVAVQRHLDEGSREVCLIPGDADGYWELSHRILRGDNFELYSPPRQVMRMPGFPLLLAIPQFVFGESLLAVRLWLAIIGTAGCGFVYLLGKELVDTRTGGWAAAVVALSPVHAIFSVLLLSETSFATVLTASLWFYAVLRRRLRESNESPAVPGEKPDHIRVCRALRHTGSGTFGLALLVGLLMAFATYLRPTWLLIGPLSAVMLLGRHQFRSRFIAAALLMIGLCGALLPWGYRNHAVTGHFTLTTFWVGPSLYDGLNPRANGDSEMSFFEDDNLLSRMSEYEMDREYRRRAWEYARENSVRAVELMFIKLTRYWMLWPNAAQFRAWWMQAVVGLSSALLILPAMYGTWHRRRDWELLAIAWGPALYFAAVHMLFVGSIRYRLPAELPLAVLAGVGWVALINRVRGESGAAA